MSSELFRRKSLDRISSPEELHDYMRVTSPRLWMLLTAIVVLLAGFTVYASMTTMENTMSIQVEIENYTFEQEDGSTEKFTLVTAALPISMKDIIQTGMTVRIGQETGMVSWIGTSMDEDVVNVIFEMNHDYLLMPDGQSDAVLVLDQILHDRLDHAVPHQFGAGLGLPRQLGGDAAEDRLARPEGLVQLPQRIRGAGIGRVEKAAALHGQRQDRRVRAVERLLRRFRAGHPLRQLRLFQRKAPQPVPLREQQGGQTDGAPVAADQG